MNCVERTHSYIRWKWKITKITVLSMFYNEHISSDYMFDTIMAPAFWFLDQFTAILGPLFVFLVVFLTVRKRKTSINQVDVGIYSFYNCSHQWC